jgi:hypothetical protein
VLAALERWGPAGTERSSGKLNFAPPSENSEWYHTVSIPVMNGALPYIDPDGGNGGDDVGVVETWSRPEAEELTPGNIEAIKNAVAKAEWREDVRAAMWVGKAIAPILGLDPELDKTQIKQIIRELIFQKAEDNPGEDQGSETCVFVMPGDGSAPVPPTGAE